MSADKRSIHLDPMEWRDAMKDIAKPATEAAKKKGAKPAAGTKAGKPTKR